MLPLYHHRLKLGQTGTAHRRRKESLQGSLIGQSLHMLRLLDSRLRRRKQ